MGEHLKIFKFQFDGTVNLIKAPDIFGATIGILRFFNRLNIQPETLDISPAEQQAIDFFLNSYPGLILNEQGLMAEEEVPLPPPK